MFRLKAFSYSSRDLQFAGITAQFLQDNQPRSAVNVLRGMHYQISIPRESLFVFFLDVFLT